MKTRYERLLPACLLLGLATATGAAQSAAVLTGSARSHSYQIIVLDANDTTLFQLIDSWHATGTEAFSSISAASPLPADLGWSGTVLSRQTSTFLPPAPAFGTPFTGVAIPVAAASADPVQTDATLNSQVAGMSRVFVDFSLDEPAIWRWSAAELSATSAGTGETRFLLGLYDTDTVNNDAFFERTLVGETHGPDSASGVLPAGNWQLTVALDAQADHAFTTGSGEQFIYLTDGRFTLAPVPLPPALALLLPGWLALVRPRRRHGR